MNKLDTEIYWIKQLLGDMIEAEETYAGKYVITDDYTFAPGSFSGKNVITIDSQATYGKYVIGSNLDSEYIYKYCVFKVKLINNRDADGNTLNNDLWNYLALAFQDATAPAYNFNHIYLTSTPNKGDLDVNKRYVRELRLGAWFRKKREEN